jgi:hypothetical protein
MRSRAGSNRKGPNPMRQLIVAIRCAARQIDTPASRACARLDAASIAKTFVEKMPNTIKGALAKTARAMMKSLPDLSDANERARVAAELIQIADLLATEDPATSITRLRAAREAEELQQEARGH